MTGEALAEAFNQILDQHFNEEKEKGTDEKIVFNGTLSALCHVLSQVIGFIGAFSSLAVAEGALEQLAEDVKKRLPEAATNFREAAIGEGSIEDRVDE